MLFLDRLLMAVVGITFLAGGGYISIKALESKNLMECALFGLLGVGIGMFLAVCAIAGPPN